MKIQTCNEITGMINEKNAKLASQLREEIKKSHKIGFKKKGEYVATFFETADLIRMILDHLQVEPHCARTVKATLKPTKEKK